MKLNKVFVYGIFLDEDSRKAYGMTNPEYATVQGYATFGHYIVQAERVKNTEACLTGLICDIQPDKWGNLDKLERGYDREVITTTAGDRAWIYVRRKHA